MYSKVAFSCLFAAWSALALFTTAFSDDTNRLDNIQDASGMFNERGYLKSNSFSLSGNEVINDFNGNLIYTQRLFYVPLSENGLHVDLKLCYNGNVSHTAFGARSGLNGIMQTPVNLPEWIISLNGIAIQTLNFENELVSWENDTSFTAAIAYNDDVAAHIEGYHKCYRESSSGGAHGVISLLMEDGSVREYYSLAGDDNAPFQMIGGEYRSCSKDDADRGYLWEYGTALAGYFTLFRSDGTKVVFRTYQPDYRTDLDCVAAFPKPRVDYPRIMLPVRFEDHMGHVINLDYLHSYRGHEVWGRPLLNSAGEFGFTWNAPGDTWLIDDLVINSHGSGQVAIKFGSTPIDTGIIVGQRIDLIGDATRAMIDHIHDQISRPTDFRYRQYSRFYRDLHFEDVWRRINACEGRSRDAANAYLVEPWRLWSITYPDGGRLYAQYYDDRATAWGQESNLGAVDTLSIDYDHTLDCQSGSLPPKYPCKKSDRFALLGRDPFFLNVIAATRRTGAANRIENTDSLILSWEDNNLDQCIDPEDRFFTKRWFGKDSLQVSPLADLAPVKERRLTYAYFPEKGPFSSRSRDRGWALKMLSSLERDRRYSQNQVLKEYYWDTECLEFLCLGTMQLDSLRTTYDGEKSLERYSYQWLGNPALDTVCNMTRKDIVDPWGIRSETHYQTSWMNLTNPASAYYNSSLIEQQKVVRDANDQLLQKTSRQYHMAPEDGGYAGQLWSSTEYLLDTTGATISTTINSYHYYTADAPSTMHRGATKLHIDPLEDTTYFFCSAGLESMTYRLLDHEGGVDIVQDEIDFAEAGPGWFKMQKRAGSTTLTWRRRVDQRGRVEWLISPNGYRSDVYYDHADRLFKLILPGGYKPSTKDPSLPPGPQDTSWTIWNLYDDAARGIDGSPVSVTQRIRVGRTKASQESRVWFNEMSQPFRHDAVSPDGSCDSTLSYFDYAGRLVAQQDQLGYLTRSSFDHLDRPLKTSYPDVHSSFDSTLYWVTDADDVGLSSLFAFRNGTIFAKEYLDENSHQVIEYSDIRGKLRLRQTFDGTTPLSTYLDYDDLGNLTRVIKPMGDEVRYRYDSFGRLIEESSADLDSTIAGAPYGRITYEYDKNGNLIRRQDPMLRLSYNPAHTVKQYFTYDGLNRVTESGIESNLQDTITLIPLRRLFYDQAASSNSRGRLSLSWEFDYGRHCHYAERYHYDPRGRIARQVNYFHAVLDSTTVPGHPELTTFTAHGDSLVLLFAYDWADQLTSITYPDGSVVKYDYDARGRLTAVGGSAVADSTKFAQMSYTPRDQLQIVRLGQGLQQLNYAYNERGWLKSINNGTSSPAGAPSDVFGEQIYYDDFPNPPSGVVPQYNGNLQGQTISVNGGANTFSYRYDESDRLKIKHFGEYALESFTYDANGNIATQLDWLGRTFNNIYHAGTNKLTVVDMLNAASDDTLAYDYNGNVASHSGKKAAFHHDIYGRMYATSVEVPYGIDSVHHAHSATGDRIYKRYFHPYRVECSQARSGEGEGGEEGEPTRPPSDSASLWCMEADTTATYYVWGQGRILAEYRRPYAGAVHTNFIYAGASRIALRDSLNQLAYYLNDHLGSTSVVLDSSGTVRSGYLYSAFGLSLAEIGGSPQSYRYTGKPLDREAGLNLYWYGARFYDPEIGRFLALDPAASKYPGLSPYAYCANNPLKNVDPTGGSPFLAIAGVAAAIVNTALDVVDVCAVAQSMADYDTNPSTENAIWLGIDILGALPVVHGAGLIRHSDDILSDAKNLLRATDAGADAARITERGAAAANKVQQWAARATKGAAGTDSHHMLPQSKKLKDYFQRAGLDIEAFKVDLPTDSHRFKSAGGLHTTAQNWNKQWEEFFSANPDATAEQIMEQLESMVETLE